MSAGQQIVGIDLETLFDVSSHRRDIAAPFGDIGQVVVGRTAIWLQFEAAAVEPLGPVEIAFV